MAPKKGKKGGKKGKKGKGKEKKEEPVEKRLSANQKVWEARLKAIEKSKESFKGNAEYLASKHDSLQTNMKQVELDTIDVITFLRTQDSKKSDEVEKLQAELDKAIKQHGKEKTTLVEDYNLQIKELQNQINKKQDDIVLMANELKHVKEFRKKRAAMQRELDEIKDGMFLADRQHKQETERMTDKFQNEKKAMQRDTNQKISELADRAHQQAITNLDETTRSIYKENVRLTEALKFHQNEEELLLKSNASLETENQKFRHDLVDLDSVSHQEVAVSQKQKTQLAQLEAKIGGLEQALNLVASDHEAKMNGLKKASEIETDSSQIELAKLARLLELKSDECIKVRKLGRNLLLQRTDMEQSFLDSLNDTREQLALEHGLKPKKISVTTLPWYQKELILRSLFGKMNQANGARRVHAAKGVVDPPYEDPAEERYDKNSTFLTQAELDTALQNLTTELNSELFSSDPQIPGQPEPITERTEGTTN